MAFPNHNLHDIHRLQRPSRTFLRFLLLNFRSWTTMNAPSISRTGFSRADSAGDSDSDTSDEINDYYQPISSQDGEGDDDENLDSDSNSNSTEPNINGYRSIHPHSHSSLSNHDYQGASENGMRSVNLSSEGQEDRESQGHEEEEEEERRRAESDGAVRRAFEEDESRRNAPLPAENALRVMEAMRGVSFSGLAPDWASHIPEDRWLDQLRRLWQPPHSAS